MSEPEKPLGGRGGLEAHFFLPMPSIQRLILGQGLRSPVLCLQVTIWDQGW